MMGPKRQRGFSLFVAIFLITTILVVAVIAAATLTSRSVTTAQGILAARAFYAARTGIEYAIAQAVPPGQGCTNVGAVVAIEGFNVGLQCQESAVNQGGTSFVMYHLSATASSGNLTAGTFVTRTVRTTITGEP